MVVKHSPSGNATYEKIRAIFLRILVLKPSNVGLEWECVEPGRVGHTDVQRRRSQRHPFWLILFKGRAATISRLLSLRALLATSLIFGQVLRAWRKSYGDYAVPYTRMFQVVQFVVVSTHSKTKAHCQEPERSSEWFPQKDALCCLFFGPRTTAGQKSQLTMPAQ